MVVLKTQPNAPLETIYEESGSFVASNPNIQRQLNNHVRTNGTINGLISARSIPSIDSQRYRGNVNQHKPPIEVQFRNGSKRYIHPSTAAAMIMDRRKFFNSSQNNLSSKPLPNSRFQQTFNTKVHRVNFQAKPPVVITIITADDLQQAGVTPIQSSSPDESTRSISISTSTQSQSTSSNETIKARKNIHKVSFAPLPITPTQSSIHSLSNHSTPNPRSSSSLSQLSQEQQIAANQRQSITPSKSFPADPNQRHSVTPSRSFPADPNQRLSVTPSKSFYADPNQRYSVTPSQSLSTDSTLLTPGLSPRRSNSSLHIALTNERLERNVSFNSNLPNIISSSNETVKYTDQQNTTVLIGGGTHSAFRPFLKPIHINQNSLPIATRTPLVINGTPHKPSQQQRQMLPYTQFHHQQYPSMSSSNITQVAVHSIPVQNQRVISNYSIVPKQIVFDVATKPLSNFKSLTQTNPSNYGQKSIPITTNHNINNSSTLPNVMNISAPLEKSLSVTVSPNMKWYNVTSNNINDIPRLSNRYSGIPLRITIPVVTPTHNQKLVMTHRSALEKRLLNAGLSPETVALYERILDVAGNHPPRILSPPKLIDPYPYISLQ